MDRMEQLEKNFSRIFWIRALMNVKVINVVMSLFYLHRGLQLEEIFYLAIIWSATNIIFEIPSSFLADKWGRKKTIAMGVIAGLFYWIFFLLAHSFLMFAIGIMWYAFSIAMLSGTQEALMYDSARELGKENESLKKLGNFHSAMSIFKIFTPLLAVFIAAQLTEMQLVSLISIDIVATLVALFFTLRLTEANHYVDVEEIESGVLYDAWTLLTKNKMLLRGIISRVGIFISFLVTWHYYQVFFTDIGLPLIILGVGWSVNHIMIFFVHKYIGSIIHPRHVSIGIDIINIIYTAILLLFVILWVVFPNPYVLYFLFITNSSIQSWRRPLFSEFFNKQSKSYNRATTLSLSNFMKSLLDIPIVFLAAFLIKSNVMFPYVLSLVIALVVITFFRLHTQKTVPPISKHT
jgi:MFS family permease